MTTQPEEGSRGNTLPVEQIAGHDVGNWVEFEHRRGVNYAGYLIGLEVNCAIIDDTTLCEARPRFVQTNHYVLEVYGHGAYRLNQGALVTVYEPEVTVADQAAQAAHELRESLQ